MNIWQAEKADEWLILLDSRGGYVTHQELLEMPFSQSTLGLKTVLDSGFVRRNDSGYYITLLGYNRLDLMVAAEVMSQ